MNEHQYYVYIITNPNKTVLYTGVTNNLELRLLQHYENKGNPKTFAGKYYCFILIWFEIYDKISDAIDREKEIKGWRREKKVALINELNPEWKALNKFARE